MVANRLVALLTLRCPVCCRGKVYHSLFGMHETCPVCHTKFERETGYFLNAMFIAYAVGFLILIPTTLLLFSVGVSPLVFAVIISIVALAITPLIFRYSRVIWMHSDQILDPRPEHSTESGA